MIYIITIYAIITKFKILLIKEMYQLSSCKWCNINCNIIFSTKFNYKTLAKKISTTTYFEIQLLDFIFFMFLTLMSNFINQKLFTIQSIKLFFIHHLRLQTLKI